MSRAWTVLPRLRWRKTTGSPHHRGTSPPRGSSLQPWSPSPWAPSGSTGPSRSALLGSSIFSSAQSLSRPRDGGQPELHVDRLSGHAITTNRPSGPPLWRAAMASPLRLRIFHTAAGWSQHLLHHPGTIITSIPARPRDHAETVEVVVPVVESSRLHEPKRSSAHRTIRAMQTAGRRGCDNPGPGRYACPTG